MLSEDVFEKSFGILLNRHGKRYNADLASVYFDRCRKIPDEAFKEIIESIVDHEKFFPTPGAIKDAWHIWLDQRPHKKQYREKTQCPSCGSQGYYIYRKFNTAANKWYEHIARCSYCQNWRGLLGDGIPMASRHDLEMENCVIVEFWKNEDIKPLKSLNECVEVVGKRIPKAKTSESEREERVAKLKRQAEEICAMETTAQEGKE